MAYHRMYDHLPVEETEELKSSTEEHGPEEIDANVILCDTSSPPRDHGSYSLRLATDEHLHEIMSALAESPVYNPIGFVGEEYGLEDPKDDCKPRFFAWPIKLKKHVQLEVRPYQVFYTGKQEIKRETILSKPYYSRLSTECARLDFTINAECEASLGGRFKVIATSDMETKSRDYNILFMRKPEPRYHPNLLDTGRRF